MFIILYESRRTAIVVIRNPYSRAISLFQHWFKSGSLNENDAKSAFKNFIDTVHEIRENDYIRRQTRLGKCRHNMIVYFKDQNDFIEMNDSSIFVNYLFQYEFMKKSVESLFKLKIIRSNQYKPKDKNKVNSCNRNLWNSLVTRPEVQHKVIDCFAQDFSNFNCPIDSFGPPEFCSPLKMK